MYSTCIFCQKSLGANEGLEHFPVGRRIAFDSEKGRLWVVCTHCARWNLSPLESRWEAVEEAERAFRGTRIRISTDNIGMARLREGLDLVRIGKPLRPEFAAWRYGDQFVRRQRAYIAMSAIGLGAPGISSLYNMLPSVLMSSSGSPLLQTGAMLALAASTGGLAYELYGSLVGRVLIRDSGGRTIAQTRDDMSYATVDMSRGDGEWELKLRSRAMFRRGPKPPERDSYGNSYRPRELSLFHDDARRAIATIISHTNRMGGGRRRVRAALNILETTKSSEDLLLTGGIKRDRKTAALKRADNEPYVLRWMPRENRLALEMLLHESDERRAMEGELKELEQRWKEAEEIASIADGLTLPPAISARLEEMKASKRMPNVDR